MALWSNLLEIFKRPTMGDILTELAMFTIPLWVAVLVGVLVGWAWKPKWENLGREFFDSFVSKGFSKIVALSTSALKFQLPGCISSIPDNGIQTNFSSSQPDFASDCSSSQLEKEKSNIVNEDDLQVLYKLVEEKDGGPAWIQMMDRSTSTMTYQAWRRDVENLAVLLLCSTFCYLHCFIWLPVLSSAIP